MARIALVIAVLALGLGGWALLDRECLRCELARVDDAQQGLEARLVEAERALASLREGAPDANPLLEAPAVASGLEGAGGATGAPASQGPRLAAAPRAPAGVEERLAQLEKELAATREARAASKAAATGAGSAFVLSAPTFLGSLDQAEKQLKLDAAQKAGLERVIDEVERELDALSTRRNDEGKTLKELQDAFRPEAGIGEDGVARFHEQMAALARFRNSKVPGTNETYAEAERRIRQEGKSRARGYLSPEQAKTWDRSHVDPLFRGGSNANNAVVWTAVGGGGDGSPMHINVGGR
jgi:hypothetical protein